MEEQKRKSTHASVRAKLKIGNLVDQHCRKNNLGYAEYDKGMSDRAIAEMVSDALGEEVTKNNVASIRMELVGGLAPGRNSGERTERLAALEAENADLRARLDHLEERVEELEGRSDIRPSNSTTVAQPFL